MNLNSKKTLLFILVITALLCSRAMFWFFDDPEGPNLLVVTVMAAILYVLSLVGFALRPSATGPKKLLLPILIQIIIATGLYFFLR
jgi:hypothetical protein